jgi:hypothetical protein
MGKRRLHAIELPEPLFTHNEKDFSFAASAIARGSEVEA